MVAEWAKALPQIQVEVPGLNPTWGCIMEKILTKKELSGTYCHCLRWRDSTEVALASSTNFLREQAWFGRQLKVCSLMRNY